MAGRALWAEATEEFDFSGHDKVVLAEACEVVDTMANLKATAKREGMSMKSSQGVKPHWALTELRQQRLVLIRLLRQIKLPVVDEARPAERRRSPHLRSIAEA